MSDAPQGRKLPIWVFILALMAMAAVAGGVGWLIASSAPAPVVPSPTPVATSTVVTAPTVAPTGTVPATATVEPTVTPKPGLGYTPGPDETGTNWAYLKTAYLKDGYVYVTVDYIVIGEGTDGWFITNDNPKLRTFPLAKTCPCRYRVEGGSSLSGALTPVAFLNKWKVAASSKMIKKNPYKLTIKHGVVTKLDNEWLP